MRMASGPLEMTPKFSAMLGPKIQGLVSLPWSKGSDVWATVLEIASNGLTTGV